MIKIKSKRIILAYGLFDGYIYVENGKIVDVSALDKPCDEEYDFQDSYISPGLIDIHTHGAGGYPFINNTVHDVVQACNFMLRHGVTGILPTVTAGAYETMKCALENIAIAKRNGLTENTILGAHLEGPYLSKEQCGAQCPTFITKPVHDDYVYLVENYGDTLKRWTYAPENDEDGAFCKYLTEHGIIASIGHSNATYDDVSTAIENGSNLVTHLYSCTSTVKREKGFRRLGVIESAFLSDEMNVEIIADGKHLPSELISMILKIKGVHRVIACSDSLEIAGTSVKSGTMSGTDFIVEDGVCKLKDRSAFAGSVATADDLLKVLVLECELKITDAIKLLSENPARLLNVQKGRIVVGYDADLIALDDELNLQKVMVNGKFIEERKERI